MQSVFKAGLFSLMVVVLASCSDMGIGGGTGEQGFQRKYAVARDALERGKYARASQIYAEMIPNAGPLAPRLRLEYAHTQLRAGHFAQASAQAAGLVRGLDGSAKSAALAVYGTAEHELALAAIAAGERAAARRHFLAAQTALGAMIAAHPELDPMGAMAGRHASIAARLRRL